MKIIKRFLCKLSIFAKENKSTSKNSNMKGLELTSYIIAYFDNVGDLVTNKRLQKLLYYIKAWGLVYFEDGVIDDEFEAWVHGPVSPDVYRSYKIFGYNPIKLDYKGVSSSEYLEKYKKDHSSLSEKLEMVDAVLQKYGQLTSLNLELLSHSETPWIEARVGLSPIENSSNKIKDDVMKEYYSNK